jgi:hypothetical protein
MNHDRYFLAFTIGGVKHEHEVSKFEYVSEERRCGFRNTLGQPMEPATAGFSAGSVSGRLEYRPCVAKFEEWHVLWGGDLDHSGCLPVE